MSQLAAKRPGPMSVLMPRWVSRPEVVRPGQLIRSIRTRCSSLAAHRAAAGRSLALVVVVDDRLVRHRRDHVLEVVGPVIDGRLEAAGREQDHPGVPGERPFRLEVRVAEPIDRLVGAGLLDPLKRAQRAGVRIVDRRRPEGGLQRAAQRQQEGGRLDQLVAQPQFRVEAVGDVMDLVVGGELGVEARSDVER